MKLTAVDKAKVKAKYLEWSQQGTKKLQAFLAAQGLEAPEVPAVELKEAEIPDVILFKDINEVNIISTHVLLN